MSCSERSLPSLCLGWVAHLRGWKVIFLPLCQPSSSLPVGFPGSPDLTAEMPVCSAGVLLAEESYTPDEGGIISGSVISPVGGTKGG